MAALRDQLLCDRTAVLCGADRTAERLRELGAQLRGPDQLEDAERVDALVVDAAEWFGAGGPDGLRGCLERSWAAVAAIAAERMIPAGAPGKVVLIGPGPDAGPHAEAARAGLENLARTLSIEWARYGLTATMLAPGEETASAELADLVAFLVSAAGDYYSGCRFELGAVQPLLRTS